MSDGPGGTHAAADSNPRPRPPDRACPAAPPSFAAARRASGSGHGVFVLGGTHEMSSGGPFFRDIEVNNTGSVTNITHYMFSGHAQTESLRLGLHGPYAMAVTNGGVPSAVTMDFLSSSIPGLLSVAQRGTVTGTATGSWNSLPVTAALAGSNGQYWAPVSNGQFTIAKVRPGTYTATL